MGGKEEASRRNLTRREALGILGVGAGVGLVSTYATQTDVFAALSQGGSAGKVTFPKGAIVRTILKDVPPEALAANGATLFHEHLSNDISGLPRGRYQPPPDPNAPPQQPRTIPLYNVDLIVEEVKLAQKDGVGCIVDGGHPDMRRFLEALQIIATRTNVFIVASGGFYMQRSYPPDIAKQTEDQIADDLVTEANLDRYGAFGEIGADPNEPELTPDEKKVYRAIGKAQVRTNLPIFTHNAYGTGPDVPPEAGLRQLDVFESVGVNPNRIAIGHMCCLDDPKATVIKAIAKRGAFVGFDRVTQLLRFVSDEKRVAMVLNFLDAGYQDNLLFSSDFNGTQTLQDRPGYGRVLTNFIPMLRKAGVKDDAIHSILYDNPRRLLAFQPKKS